MNYISLSYISLNMLNYSNIKHCIKSFTMPNLCLTVESCYTSLTMLL